MVMMCHGFIASRILDDSDGLSHNRAGLLSVEARAQIRRRGGPRVKFSD